MNRSSKVNRKEALRSLIVLPAIAGLMLSAEGAADAKSTKKSVKYQNHPNGTQRCSGCSLFIPPAAHSGDGSCRVVAGSISPNGWCTAFSPRT